MGSPFGAGDHTQGVLRAIDLITGPYAILLLRLCLGVMFMAHALQKLLMFKLQGTATSPLVMVMQVALVVGAAAALAILAVLLARWRRMRKRPQQT
ncbi:MAG: DoxX family membrane protein [Devosia sp.]|nr:DoxX family membrane protein [Devosia sp.]